MQNKDLSQSVNFESERLKDKYQIIKIQQDSIENLKQQLEKLKEEQKKLIQANAPKLLHQLNLRTHLHI